MLPFIDNEQYQQYERLIVKVPKTRKSVLFLNKYIEDNVENWEYIVETIKGKQFIRYWKQPIDALNKPKEDKEEIERQKVEQYILEKKQRQEAYKQQMRQKQHLAIKERKESWVLSPLSIKLKGNPELYNPKFTDEENAAMYYCSEWLRKGVTFENESIFETVQYVYNINVQHIQKRMVESSTKSTKGKTYTWYVIQPYIMEKETQTQHYMPKTIIRALCDDNVDRRMRIIPEIEHMYKHSIHANILGTYDKYREAKDDIDNLNFHDIDYDFIQRMNFKFHNPNRHFLSISEEERIQEEVDRRIANMQENGIFSDNVNVDNIYKAVEAQLMKSYNIECYLKNFAKCYNMFTLDNKTYVDRWNGKREKVIDNRVIKEYNNNVNAKTIWGKE